jgi:transposase
MPRFSDLEDYFVCPYRHGCPYLEGLSTQWVWERYQQTDGLECHYEHIIEQFQQELAAERQLRLAAERERDQVRAQFQALHRSQFKSRKPAAPPPDKSAPTRPPKKRGAPVGHPAWQRPKPKRVDRVIELPTPQACPDCHCTNLQSLAQIHEHVQEDIVLEPRTVVTCFRHHLAHCPQCDKNVWQAGPGEMPGAYIGPSAKATAAYLRYQLNVPTRKISQFFADFFGLKFVPASAYGFERQVVRCGRPLYEDLRQKIRALPVVHADETSWRHAGQGYWVWYAGDDQLAFFHWDEHRTKEAAQSVLGEKFAGTIVADAYASYKGVRPKDWQSCLAHIKTKAKELAQELALLKGASAEPAAVRFCQDVQGWVRTVCQAHRQLPRRWRAKTAKKKACQLRQELRRICRAPHRHPKAEKFRQRLLGPEQKHLFTCFRRPNVPPTNNQAERSLRPVVIMRKVVQGTRGAAGLENHSVLRSLFETARRQGHKPHEFFVELLTKDTAQAQAALYRGNRPKPPPNRQHPRQEKNRRD